MVVVAMVLLPVLPSIPDSLPGPAAFLTLHYAPIRSAGESRLMLNMRHPPLLRGRLDTKAEPMETTPE